MNIICKNCGHNAEFHDDSGCQCYDSRNIFDCECGVSEISILRMHIIEQQARLDILTAENEKLFEVNSRTWCAYCKKEYPRTEDAMQQIREHISICEKHPMRQVEAERDALKNKLRGWLAGLDCWTDQESIEDLDDMLKEMQEALS